MTVAVESHEGAGHMQVTSFGLDIAKNVFQVHGIDAAEKDRRSKATPARPGAGFFKALPPCLVDVEACATAHYRARELLKLDHEARSVEKTDRCAAPLDEASKRLENIPGIGVVGATTIAAAFNQSSSPRFRFSSGGINQKVRIPTNRTLINYT